MKFRTKLAAVSMALVLVPLSAPAAQAAYTPVPSSCYAQMDTVKKDPLDNGQIVQIGVDGATSPQMLAYDTDMHLGYVPKVLTLVSSSETSAEYRYRYYGLSTEGTLSYHVFVTTKSTGETNLTSTTIKTGWTSTVDLVATTHNHLYALSSTGKLTRWTINPDATLGGVVYLKTMTGLKDLGYAGTVTTTVNGATTARRDLMMAVTTTGALQAFHMLYSGSGTHYTYTLKNSGYSAFETIAIGACSGQAGVMVLHDTDDGYARVIYDSYIVNGITAGELSDRGTIGVAGKYSSYGS